MTMNRRDFNVLLGATAVAPVGLAEADEPAVDWSLSASLAECCSCEIPCPCNFGRPTDQRCDGNRLIEIDEGHVGGDDLAGIRFLVTFEMGRWTRIYIDDSLDDVQLARLDRILPLAFGGFVRLSRAEETVPMTVERNSDLIRFSTPESEVEMKRLAGLDGGPISISGLPSNTFHDYIQYESVRHIHNGPDRQWNHSGTNGFTSRMLATA